MKAIVLTQEDPFFIPANVAKLCRVAEVAEIVVIDSSGSLKNMGRRFYLWFGVAQVAKLGLKYVWRKLLDRLDPWLGWRLLHGQGSLASIARLNGIPCRVIVDVNDRDFVAHVRELNPDLIVSYSAPQVVKEPLLSLPRHGVINVHGSLLPDFRGLLPSFWVLYDDQKDTGATVHFMSGQIDDGKIILQQKIPIGGVKSMYAVMEKTKRLGGDLVVEAVQALGNNAVAPRENNASAGRYFTWPTREQTRAFRDKGYRLI